LTVGSSNSLYAIELSSTAGYLNVTGLTFSNNQLGGIKAIYVSATPSLVIRSSVFQSIGMEVGDSLIFSGPLSEFQINNVNFTDNSLVGDVESSDWLINIDSFTIQQDRLLQMNNVRVTNSNVALFRLDRIQNYSNITSSFTITNITYSSCYFSQPETLIRFTGMEMTTPFTIAMSNIVFTDIEFFLTGNLMKFEQQLSNAVTVTGLSITNTTNSHIDTESANALNTLLPVKVLISGLTSSDVNCGFRSFILLGEGSELTVTSSSIRRFYTLGEGAFLTTNARNSKAIINNSTIQYNSASEGGVFLAENGGSIVVTSCSILNNFAIVSGVIKTNNNGVFLMSSTVLSSNYALSIPISEIFDVTFVPTITGCDIFSNENLSKDTVITSIENTARCDKLCWLSTTYKEYILNNTGLLDRTSTEF